MNREWVSKVARLVLLGAMAIAFAMPTQADTAKAACKACSGGSCINVDGGANRCTEDSGGGCNVSGGTCNQEETIE